MNVLYIGITTPAFSHGVVYRSVPIKDRWYTYRGEDYGTTLQLSEIEDFFIILDDLDEKELFKTYLKYGVTASEI